MESSARTNRLISEKSPYLIQHAYNPVDWFPWGDEAFEKARKENKPIFLSIGYSTCHWCHVMEEESFSSQRMAALINESYVPIKVDREERPDIDHIYMQAVMAMSGSGGWPMTVFLTPDRKPFYGGTYFPPEDRWGKPGLERVLLAIADKWKNEREKVLEAGDELTRAVQTPSEAQRGGALPLDATMLMAAYQQLIHQYDAEHGGFGGAPKFPRSHTLSFLLRHWKRTREPKALAMTEQTLREMAKGGMYDHAGGGFHRYSTDEKWHVPHFEKMLYDQATLARTYLEAYQATRNETYADAAREIFEYVMRDMTDPDRGGFYSAEDADSAGDPADPKAKSEGAFYIWGSGEIEAALGPDAALFGYIFDVRAGGNVAQDPQGEFGDKNVLHRVHSDEEAAENFHKSVGEVRSIVKNCLAKLLTLRAARKRPLLDDKILTDWNGLMISSFAFGFRVLGDIRYRNAAQSAANFVLRNLKRKSDGRLMHRYADGEVTVPGFLEDYAFFINGLCDVYEATFEARFLAEARFFTGEMVRLFWDEGQGGFFITGVDGEKLIMRPKEFYDGAIPSGNSLAVLALARVARFTSELKWEEFARKTLESAAASPMGQVPSQYPQMMIALDFLVGPAVEIVIAGEEFDPSVPAALNAVYSRFLPNKIVAFNFQEGENAAGMEKVSPFIRGQRPLGGKLTFYVCRNHACETPATDVDKFKTLLENA